MTKVIVRREKLCPSNVETKSVSPVGSAHAPHANTGGTDAARENEVLPAMSVAVIRGGRIAVDNGG